jgi:hypothetical protein
MVRAKLWELPSRKGGQNAADRTVTGEIAEVSTSTRIDIDQSEHSSDGKNEVEIPATFRYGFL